MGIAGADREITVLQENAFKVAPLSRKRWMRHESSECACPVVVGHPPR